MSAAMMSAVETLAELLGVRFGTNENWAAHIIADLKAAGVAVVELPRFTINGQDNAVWCQSPYVEQEFSGDVVVSDRLAISVDELRKVAAALLAAADAAEATQ